MSERRPTEVSDEPRGIEPYRRPRWVTVSLIVVAILVLLFIILNVTGVAPGGGHGPGRHG